MGKDSPLGDRNERVKRIYVISVIVDRLKLCLLLCLLKVMDLNKETFSVSPLHAKGFIACVAWRFKQFERACTKQRSRENERQRLPRSFNLEVL